MEFLKSFYKLFIRYIRPFKNDNDLGPALQHERSAWRGSVLEDKKRGKESTAR